MIVFFQKIINLQEVVSSYLTGPKMRGYDVKTNKNHSHHGMLLL
jgi:hypothetical protein